MTVNIALRRQLWQLDYFTEGSIPDALIGVPQGWTPDQIKQFQDYWDTEFAGDLAKRRRAKFVPGETAAKVVQTKEPQHKDDFDEWLARIICFAFSVPPQWATKAMNRATADNQSAQSEEEGLEPTKEWVKDLIDEVVAEEFASPDLELHWLDEDEGDPETVLEGRLKVGALTLNEMRDALGLDPFDNAAADRPMVLTATGYVPIEANADGEGATVGANGQGRSTRSSASAIQKYSPYQPRVPAGNSDGGQWTMGDGGIEAAESTNESDQNGSLRPLQYAALETATRTDAADVANPGTQYAAGNEEEEFRENRAGTPLEGTEEQQARLQSSDVAWRTVLSQVRKLDPSWKPSPVLADPTSIEGNIAELKAWTEEAKGYLSRLRDLGLPRDPRTGDLVSPGQAKTGNPFIDYTTEKLMDILGEVMDQIGPRPDLGPKEYGTLVHTEFASAVRAAGLRGIDTNDVERTFGVQPNAPYGAKDSIRPDAILRDDDGSNIIAIYDVKTGTGLSKFRIIQIRVRTDSESTIPLIELNRGRGPAWKSR
jgi:hypothetical protein